MEEVLAESQVEIKGLRDELISTRRACWEAQRLAEKLRVQHDEAQAAAAQWQARASATEADASQLSQLQAENQDLRQSWDACKADLERQTAARRVLAGELKDTQTVLSDVQSKLARVQEESAQRGRKVEDQSAQILLLKKQLLEAEEEVQAAEEELQQLKAAKPTADLSGPPGIDGFGFSTHSHAPPSSSHNHVGDLWTELQQALARNEALVAGLAEANAALASATDRAAVLEAANAELEAAREGAAARPAPLPPQPPPRDGAPPSRSASHDAIAPPPNGRDDVEPQGYAAAAAAGPGPPLPAAFSQLSMPPSVASSMATGSWYQPHDAIAPGAFAHLPVEQLDALLRRSLLLQEQYKRSRDKLLQLTNRHGEEVERLQSEVNVLVDSLQDAEVMSDSWQARARLCMSQVERLKDMLAESAAWSTSGAEAEAAGAPALASTAPPSQPAASAPAQPLPPGAPPALESSNGAAGSAVSTQGAADTASQAQGQGDRYAVSGGSATGGEAPASSSAGGALGAVVPDSMAAALQLKLQQEAQIAALQLQLETVTAEALGTVQLSGQVGRSVLPALYSIEERLLRLRETVE